MFNIFVALDNLSAWRTKFPSSNVSEIWHFPSRIRSMCYILTNDIMGFPQYGSLNKVQNWISQNLKYSIQISHQNSLFIRSFPSVYTFRFRISNSFQVFNDNDECGKLGISWYHACASEVR